MYEFHVSRLAREKFGFDQTLFATDGNVVLRISWLRALSRRRSIRNVTWQITLNALCAQVRSMPLV